MTWVVQCQVVTEKDGWECSHGTPTFNLLPAFVGTDIGQVVKIAKEIVDPGHYAKEIHVSAVLT